MGKAGRGILFLAFVLAYQGPDSLAFYPAQSDPSSTQTGSLLKGRSAVCVGIA